MTNQITQQSKSDPKGKAIASFLLGITSIIITIGQIYDLLSPGATEAFGLPQMFKFTGKIVEALGEKLSYGLLLTPIFGLILGILGLKSTKKYMAIGGIILSIVGLFGLIIFSFLALGFATGM